VLRKGLASLAVIATALLGAATNAAAAPVPTIVFNVRDYGATGNGHTVDTPALNRAILAASTAAGGGVVLFPAGTYLSTSIHLRSNVTLQLAAGSTILAAARGFDPPEPNPFSQFQDFGHSHFHDALLWGTNLVNVGFTGAGTIDGGGHLATGRIAAGQGDKVISIAVCDGLAISGITIRRAGHFAILINACNHVAVDGLTISTVSDRDGFNVINSSNVTVRNSTILSQDDALVLKSDFALGRTLLSQNIDVSGTTVLSTNNNALQFGSETCGDFTNVSFSHITIQGAGKAGIGMVSMDGAHISHVSYSDVRMTRAATPIYMKIGDRGSCPGHPGAGSISDVTITGVVGTNLFHPGSSRVEFTSTIAGRPGHPVSNVTVTGVDLTVPGGHPASDASIVPPDNNLHAPSSFGTRPSYGWWLRNVSGITFRQSTVRFDRDDGRPAFQSNRGQSVTLDTIVAERGTASPYDVGFTAVTGAQVTACTTTTGAPCRVHTA
jgi:glycosyl hydrolase family 28